MQNLEHNPKRPTASSVLAVTAMLAMGGCTLPDTIAERGVMSDAPRTARAVPEPAGAGPRRAAAVESLGTGLQPGRVARSGRTLPVVSGDRQVQLDYADADVAWVVRDVLRDVLGLTVTVDPAVQGRVTLRTNGRVPIAEVPQLLDQALAPLGLGIAASGGRVRVGRIADLEAPGVSAGETRLIPLQHVAAAAVLPALQQSLPEGVRLQADPTGRGLVATGPAAGIEALESMVGLFDTDALRARSFGLYPLANTTPAAALGALQAIFPDSQGVRLLAMERLNAILVVADQPGTLARVRRTVMQLDIQRAATAGVHVYPVLNRRASDLADMLQRIFALQPQASPAARTGPAGGFGALQVQSPSEDGAGPGGRGSLAARVPGAPEPAAAAPPPQPGLQPQDLGLAGPVRIQADNGRNALVILASPVDYGVIETTIRRLDVRPRQVFIEAVIAEVTLNDQLRYGIDYSLKSGSSSLTSVPALASSALTGGLAYILRGANIGLTLQALSAITDVKVVSAPRVLVLDNETATLQVGDQVPILTRSSQSTQTANAPIVDSVEMRDTGVILAVRARIAAGGTVALDVFQEVSNAVNTNSSALNSPTIQLRRLQSTIQVQTGETIALGGLMRDSSTNGRSGIPGLSSIPIAGALFGTRQQEAGRSELLVLMTPRVVEDGADIRAVTEELRAKLDSLAPTFGQSIRPPLPQDRYDPAPPPSRGVRISP